MIYQRVKMLLLECDDGISLLQLKKVHLKDGSSKTDSSHTLKNMSYVVKQVSTAEKH